MSVCRKSASLILVQDDLKVLLLKRNQDISFGGSYVFPGGIVEEEDYQKSIQLKEIISKYHNKFNNYQYHKWYDASIVAAIRETIEETNLQLDYNQTCQLMKPFIRIITPHVMKKRYDTQFFIMNFNLNQEKIQVNKDESQDYEWGTPLYFLEKCINKQITLFPPIFLQLLILNQLQKVSNIQEYIQSGNNLKHTFPHLFQFGKNVIKAYPDNGYDLKSLFEKEQTEYLKIELQQWYNLQERGDFRFEFKENLESFKGIVGSFRDSPLALLDGTIINQKQFVQNKGKL